MTVACGCDDEKEGSMDRGMVSEIVLTSHKTTLYAFDWAWVVKCLLEQVLLFFLCGRQLPRVPSFHHWAPTPNQVPLNFLGKHRHTSPSTRIAQFGRQSLGDVMQISWPGSEWFKLVVWAKEPPKFGLLQPHCRRHNLG